ncbi:hypothetical protein FRC98_18940 [Lujinxingia vulgaris]|uniref:Uncharacterized protein n=1 Tax=Lujinxingia vulgaris TaxID=2600176 RepID=A0A5C6X3Z0_9DELT|nr:hypothetical protein [Lujinxingia vulgaris]TXD34272.1 hypothetical protein FRC98_18940 [Lujinxingia vulgaris]
MQSKKWSPFVTEDDAGDFAIAYTNTAAIGEHPCAQTSRGGSIYRDANDHGQLDAPTLASINE